MGEISEGKVEANRAAVRAAYRKLIDEVAGKEEELSNIDNDQLLDYMKHNEELFAQVTTPQEAVMDAVSVKNLSTLCRKQAEQMCANIAQFRHEEYGERLVASMGGECGQHLVRRKWVILGKQVKIFFRRSPTLTYMYGALDTTPPPPKIKKQKDPKSRQATRVADLKETTATVLAEAEKSENQTEQMVIHVFRYLVTKFMEAGKRPISYFRFVLDPDCFGTSIENMFHVSFLVKEGKADISLCEETGMPLISPKSKMNENHNEHKNQVVMNINMRDWKVLVKELRIEVAMIIPPGE